MQVDSFGQMIYDADEVFDIVMKVVNQDHLPGPFMIDDASINIAATNEAAGYQALMPYAVQDVTQSEFDRTMQKTWHMPNSYKELDICEHVLSLCNNQAEMQRCGDELLKYQDRNLFDVLRYMKYLVDLMDLNNVIWGVGRGSSVSSYVLYKLRVHRIDSMFYKLDIGEFLR